LGGKEGGEGGGCSVFQAEKDFQQKKEKKRAGSKEPHSFYFGKKGGTKKKSVPCIPGWGAEGPKRGKGSLFNLRKFGRA